MIEKLTGVYSLGEELPSPSRIPLILVHPWFGEGYHNFRRIGEFHKDYHSALNHLLRMSSGKRNIFVFEVGSKIETGETIKKIETLAGKCGVYIIPTLENMFGAISHPEYMTWEETADFLKKYGDSFYFSGGFLGKRYSKSMKKEVWNGCLGTAYESLNKTGIKGNFLWNCCFTIPQEWTKKP
jgi:hypothetical protein